MSLRAFPCETNFPSDSVSLAQALALRVYSCTTPLPCPSLSLKVWLCVLCHSAHRWSWLSLVSLGLSLLVWEMGILRSSSQGLLGAPVNWCTGGLLSCKVCAAGLVPWRFWVQNAPCSLNAAGDPVSQSEQELVETEWIWVDWKEAGGKPVGRQLPSCGYRGAPEDRIRVEGETLDSHDWVPESRLAWS